MTNSEKPPVESAEKRTTKDYVVIGVVVLLAFGLTVMMIMYLARMLKPPVTAGSGTPTVVVTADNTGTVRITEAPPNFSIEAIARPPENGTVLIIPPEAAPLPPFFDAQTPPPAPAVPITPPQVVSVTPPPAAPATRPPSPAVTPVTGGYMLQLFAGQKESNVKAEMAKYKDLEGLHIERYKDGSTTWYRARCCTAPTKAEAEKLKSEVAKKYPELKPNVVQ